jgi:hypothetical protein
MGTWQKLPRAYEDLFEGDADLIREVKRSKRKIDRHTPAWIDYEAMLSSTEETFRTRVFFEIQDGEVVVSALDKK